MGQLKRLIQPDRPYGLMVIFFIALFCLPMCQAFRGLAAPKQPVEIVLDIQLVIDGTRSVERSVGEINWIIDTLNREIEKIRTFYHSNIHLGIMVYRDRSNTLCKNIPEIETLLPLTYVPQGRFPSVQRSMFNDCDKDRLESVYHGLYHTLTVSSFQDNSIRMVVHLGDAGDNDQAESLNQVRILFQKHNISYFPINLGKAISFKNSVEPLVVTASKTKTGQYFPSAAQFVRQLKYIIPSLLKKEY